MTRSGRDHAEPAAGRATPSAARLAVPPVAVGPLAPGASNQAVQRALRIQRAGSEPAPTSARLPAEVGRVLDAPGSPLDPSLRADMEPRFGHDFSGVRVHDDGPAWQVARALGARAFTSGSHVVLSNPAGGGLGGMDRSLMAHELAHVVQQSRGEGPRGVTDWGPEDPLERAADVAAAQMSSAVASASRSSAREPRAPGGNSSGEPVIQRQEAPRQAAIRLPFYLGSNPLEPYTVLREVSPDTWAAFARTARSRTMETPAEEWATQSRPEDLQEATLPVVALVRPPITPGPEAPFRARLWPLVSAEEPDPLATAAVIRDEIVSRWSRANARVLDGEVHIRLLEPEDAEPGRVVFPPTSTEPAEQPRSREPHIEPQRVLRFEVNGRPVPSRDGSLDVAALDAIGSQDLEEIARAVASEAIDIATVGDWVAAATTLLRAETEFWNNVESDPDAVSYNEVEAHRDLLIESPLPPLGFLHPGFEAELDAVSRPLLLLRLQSMQLYDRYAEHVRQTPPEREELVDLASSMDEVRARAASEWQAGDRFFSVVDYMSFGVGEAWYKLANVFTGDYYETRRQALNAYRSGEMSRRELDNLTRAAAQRGAAVGLVTIAVTIATAGLAPEAGVGIGRLLLYEGTANAFAGMAATSTEGIVTSQTEFREPVAQRIWAEGRRTPGDVVMSGITGFGLGVTLASGRLAFGELVTWLKTARAPSAGEALVLSEPAALATPTPPPGWSAEAVEEGVLRFTHPDVEGEIIVTRSELRYQSPAGSGMRVEFSIDLTAGAETASPAGYLSGSGPSGALPPSPEVPQLTSGERGGVAGVPSPAESAPAAEAAMTRSQPAAPSASEEEPYGVAQIFEEAQSLVPPGVYGEEALESGMSVLQPPAFMTTDPKSGDLLPWYYNPETGAYSLYSQEPLELGRRFETLHEHPGAVRQLDLASPTEARQRRPSGTRSRPRLDRYDPVRGEIVSQKHTQLARDYNSALDNLQEITVKYPNNALIAWTERTRKLGLAGERLQGRLILEVPVQTDPVPPEILTEAQNRGITIRDIEGHEY